MGITTPRPERPLQPARQRATVIRAVLTSLVVFILGAPSLTYPFSRDQGEYAYIAVAALEGKAIYRDVFNVKPPLTHLVHELALLAFGRSMLSIRILDLLWQGATALLILLIAEQSCQRRGIGVLAGAIYGLAYYAGTYWSTAQTDGFLNLPVALGVLAFLEARKRGQAWAYLISGAALGVAALFKYPIAILLPFLVLLIPRPWGRHTLRPLLWLALGFALPLALAAADLARQGTLDDFLYIQTRYIPAYTSGRSGQQGYLAGLLQHLLVLERHAILMWLSAAALAIELAHAIRQKALPQTLLIAFWWLAALAHYATQAKGYVYHAVPLLAPQAIIIAQLPYLLKDRANLSGALRVGALGLLQIFSLALVVGYTARGYPYTHQALFQVLLGDRPLEAVYDAPAFGTCGGGGATDYGTYTELEAARYIEARTLPGDTIFVWGFEPTVYFLSRRASASRFIHNDPLYGDFPWPALQQQCLAELERSAPRYIIVVRNDPIPKISGVPDDSETALARFQELAHMLAREYAPEVVMGDFTLYRRQE